MFTSFNTKAFKKISNHYKIKHYKHVLHICVCNSTLMTQSRRKRQLLEDDASWWAGLGWLPLH